MPPVLNQLSVVALKLATLLTSQYFVDTEYSSYYMLQCGQPSAKHPTTTHHNSTTHRTACVQFAAKADARDSPHSSQPALRAFPLITQMY
jgi:hypothetical protein